MARRRARAAAARAAHGARADVSDGSFLRGNRRDHGLSGEHGEDTHVPRAPEAQGDAPEARGPGGAGKCMSAPASFDETHDRAWELLPWLVSGRVDHDTDPWLAQHVAACEECRREVELQSEMHAGFAADSRVEYAPQASFEKLATRIKEFEDEEHRQAGVIAREPTPVMRIPRWLTATLAVQGVFGLALAVLVGWQTYDRMLAPNYQTLTSADPAPVARGNLRIVLAPAVTLGDFESLVDSLGATVVAGPTSAHVWTLAVPYRVSSAQFAKMLETLRADERVALAEPVAAAAAPP